MTIARSVFRASMMITLAISFSKTRWNIPTDLSRSSTYDIIQKMSELQVAHIEIIRLQPHDLQEMQAPILLAMPEEVHASSFPVLQLLRLPWHAVLRGRRVGSRACEATRAVPSHAVHLSSDVLLLLRRASHLHAHYSAGPAVSLGQLR